MDYSEFKRVINNKLKEVYGEKALVEIKEITKNNNVVKDAIHITMKGNSNPNIIPIIYLNEYYQQYVEDKIVIEEIIDAIISTRDIYDVREVTDDVTSLFCDWEQVKDRVYPVLVAKAGNEKYLEQYVTKTFLDLVIIYRIEIKGSQFVKDELGTIKLTRRLFEQYGITEDELYENALQNMRNDDYRIQNIKNVIFSMMGKENDYESDLMSEEEIYVFTNASRTYGAAGILDQEQMQKVSGGLDFYIIPSSVHEMIFIPKNNRIQVEELNEMVREVNATEVQPEAVLSNHIYIYDASKKEVVTIGESD